MSRTRMFLTLAVLFIVSLFLISFGDWLYVITYYWYLHTTTQTLTFFDKPYGALGFVMVACGALVLAIAVGLLVDWYHLLIHRPEEDKLGV